MGRISESVSEFLKNSFMFWSSTNFSIKTQHFVFKKLTKLIDNPPSPLKKAESSPKVLFYVVSSLRPRWNRHRATTTARICFCVAWRQKLCSFFSGSTNGTPMWTFWMKSCDVFTLKENFSLISLSFSLVFHKIGFWMNHAWVEGEVRMGSMFWWVRVWGVFMK